MSDPAPIIRDIVPSGWQANLGVRIMGWGWTVGYTILPASSFAWNRSGAQGFRTVLETRQPRTMQGTP